MNKEIKRPLGSRISKRSAHKILLTLLTALISLGLLEALSSAFLFRYYSAIEQPFRPRGPSSVYLVKKGLGIPVFEAITSVTPQPLYDLDSTLAYISRPGKYKVGFSVFGRTFYFDFTVPTAGVRATDYKTNMNYKHIYIFGDSFILGWGNNDEQSMPWLLQQKFSAYNVINLAQNGYGTTHAVLQYRALSSRLTSEDILVVTYGDYFLVRNYGAPSYIKILSQGVKHRLAGPDGLRGIHWPIARTFGNGELRIDYLPVVCPGSGGYCEEPDPPVKVMAEGTKAILRFFSNIDAKVVLAFISGSDDDPVVNYARQIRMSVADIRINKFSPEWDDFQPYDGHPGPTAQFNYFKKLSSALIEQGIVSERSE